VFEITRRPHHDIDAGASSSEDWRTWLPLRPRRLRHRVRELHLPQKAPHRLSQIDIDFVRDLTTNPANRHLVKAVVALAHGFGAQTIAEGVGRRRHTRPCCASSRSTSLKASTSDDPLGCPPSGDRLECSSRVAHRHRHPRGDSLTVDRSSSPAASSTSWHNSPPPPGTSFPRTTPPQCVASSSNWQTAKTGERTRPTHPPQDRVRPAPAPPDSDCCRVGYRFDLEHCAPLDICPSVYPRVKVRRAPSTEASDPMADRIRQRTKVCSCRPERSRRTRYAGHDRGRA